MSRYQRLDSLGSVQYPTTSIQDALLNEASQPERHPTEPMSPNPIDVTGYVPSIEPKKRPYSFGAKRRGRYSTLNNYGRR